MKRFTVILLVLSVSVFARAQDSLNVSKVKEFVFGGGSTDIEAAGNYAYLTFGLSGLRIIDVSDPEEPFEVGQCVTPLSAQCVAVQGDYAFVAAPNLQIIDVSNPSEPFIAATYPGTVRDIVVSGQYAYLDMIPGVIILDISTPTEPELIGSAIGLTSNVAVAEPYFYVCSADGGGGGWSNLHCFDAQDPANPVEVGNYESSADFYEVAVSGSHAYLILEDGDLLIVDFSDPANPIEAGSVNTFGGYEIEVVGDFAYLCGGSGIQVFDVSDPQDPYLYRSYDCGGIALRVVNGLIYCALENGMAIVDTESSDELGSYYPPSSALAVMLYEDYALVAAYTGGLRIMDVSNPAEAFEANYIDGDMLGGTIVGDIAYLISSFQSLTIADVSDPLVPVRVGHWYGTHDLQAIAVQGNLAFLAGDWAGLRILDVSDSSNPVSVILDTGFDEVHDVAVQDNLVYVAAAVDGLVVVDVSDPAAPIHLGSYVTPGTALGVAVSGDYAFVADSTAGLRVVDVSDPDVPTEIGACEEMEGNAIDVSLDGIHAFVACNQYGFYVVDISNPSLPAVVGYYDTRGYSRHVAVADGYAYVADRHYFGIYDVSAALGTSRQPEFVAGSFELLSAYPNPFNAATRIRFEVPRASHVNLSVYDLQGRLVEQLASRVFDAGTHTLNYDASESPSGMYFVRMTSGGFSSARKLVLLK